MFNDRFKVISDNGIKLELLRQVKDVPHRLGASIELKEIESNGSLTEIFDTIITQEEKQKIFADIKEALKEEADKISKK